MRWFAMPVSTCKIQQIHLTKLYCSLPNKPSGHNTFSPIISSIFFLHSLLTPHFTWKILNFHNVSKFLRLSKYSIYINLVSSLLLVGSHSFNNWHICLLSFTTLFTSIQNIYFVFYENFWYLPHNPPQIFLYCYHMPLYRYFHTIIGLPIPYLDILWPVQ